MTPKIRVLIVDDHIVVRKGYQYMLKSFPDLELVGEAQTGEQALKMCEDVKLDVILMDIKLPGMSGIEAIKLIKEKYPNIHIVALTSFDQEEELVLEALEAGAVGFLYKNASIDDLATAIRSASVGRSYLSPEATQSLIESKLRYPPVDFHLTRRELEVLRYLVEGLTNVEIAEKLVLSPATAKFHVSSLLKKLNATTRTEAAAIALRHKLLGD